ncbi:hypothetical protein Adt_39084 [Abeliophyllum distichum]|uniref:Uncharacterized protein n=1 Tax=Abeliophyllum distichum TaxID=126358 RepID=A0ABD1Q5S3_9LAMI
MYEGRGLEKQQQCLELLILRILGLLEKIKAIIREIRTGIYALSDELNDVSINDIVDFEEWYIKGLSKKNKKNRFDDKNEIYNPLFDFGVLEVANKKWVYDLRTPGECLGDTV